MTTINKLQKIIEETFYFICQLDASKRTQEELDTLEELIDNNFKELNKDILKNGW